MILPFVLSQFATKNIYGVPGSVDGMCVLNVMDRISQGRIQELSKEGSNECLRQEFSTKKTS